MPYNYNPQNSFPELGAETHPASTFEVLLLDFKTISTYAYSTLFFLFISLLIAGLLKFFISKDQENKMSARKVMWWSLFPFFLMIGIWLTVGFLSANLGIGVGC